MEIKIIGPLGLALIVGSSNFVKPDVPLTQIPTAFLYLGGWYVRPSRTADVWPEP
jgi:MFS transporter, putative metabolite:H+ symporter